ncbi:T9SS type A sorting domain-containing protein, partial [candidate division KSB1 bacterium]|nr:T9SS type A sorting domain-containing protein [candidate division KSB1 bacterium]
MKIQQYVVILICSFYSSIIFSYTTFSDEIIISQTGLDQPNYIQAADIDLDSDMDIIITTAGIIGWYENIDGLGTFGCLDTIATDFSGHSWYTNIAIVDMDNDGDIDILSSEWSDSSFVWHENKDSIGKSWRAHTTKTPYLFHALHSIDINANGNNDVILCTINQAILYKNINGEGMFDNGRILINNLRSACICSTDIDYDNDLDILYVDSSFSFQCLINHKNIDTFKTIKIGDIPWDINSTRGGAYARLKSIDVDQDGDKDIIYWYNSEFSGNASINWYENINIIGQIGEVYRILSAPDDFYCSDLDNDSDQDIVIYTNRNKVAWYENIDTTGRYINLQMISNNEEFYHDYYLYPLSIFAIDIDGDGDNDVLTVNYQENKVSWYKNLLETTGCNDETLRSPKKYQLHQNYPNPFNPVTTIRYELPKSDRVVIKVFDLLGRESAVLINKHQEAGYHTIQWDASDYPSGMYIVNMRAGS